MIIEKGAVTASNHRRPAYFYRSAREGLRDLLANLDAPPSAGVLLPAFIGWSPREGSGVYDPIASLGHSAGFYGLNHDLTVDVADFARMLTAGTYRAVVVIHYFGRTDPHIEGLRDLVRTHGVPLVEDSAHAFFTAAIGGRAGRHGQASIYSLHKMLPLAQGGMVVYEDDRLVRGQVSTMPDLPSLMLDYDWHAIARVRKHNFAETTRLLTDLVRRRDDVELLWPALEGDDVPQTLPLFISRGRDTVYQQLNAAGFGVVSLYHTMIEELASRPASVAAAAKILNLPVHQDVPPGSLELLVTALEAVLVRTDSERV